MAYIQTLRADAEKVSSIAKASKCCNDLVKGLQAEFPLSRVLGEPFIKFDDKGNADGALPRLIALTAIKKQLLSDPTVISPACIRYLAHSCLVFSINMGDRKTCIGASLIAVPPRILCDQQVLDVSKNLQHYKVYNSIDGTSVCLYYFGGEWRLATRTSINAWGVSLFTQTSLGDLFSGVLRGYIKTGPRNFDKKWCYNFVLKSPERHPAARTQSLTFINRVRTIGPLIIETTFPPIETRNWAEQDSDELEMRKASVGASVSASVGASVSASVGASAGASVGAKNVDVDGKHANTNASNGHARLMGRSKIPCMQEVAITNANFDQFMQKLDEVPVKDKESEQGYIFRSIDGNYPDIHIESKTRRLIRTTFYSYQRRSQNLNALILRKFIVSPEETKTLLVVCPQLAPIIQKITDQFDVAFKCVSQCAWKVTPNCDKYEAPLRTKMSIAVHTIYKKIENDIQTQHYGGNELIRGYMLNMRFYQIYYMTFFNMDTLDQHSYAFLPGNMREAAVVEI